uniref:Uncharacterized protein n=1 Tax=Arion vulgaris TaxID=1028688 RepID=A0A0B6Y872_9EUPU
MVGVKYFTINSFSIWRCGDQFLPSLNVPFPSSESQVGSTCLIGVNVDGVYVSVHFETSAHIS